MLCQSKCTDHQELPQFSILHIECNVFILPMNDANILQNQDRLLYTYDIFFKLLWIDSHLIVLTLSFLLTNPFQHLHVAIFPNHVNLNNSLYTIFWDLQTTRRLTDEVDRSRFPHVLAPTFCEAPVVARATSLLKT